MRPTPFSPAFTTTCRAQFHVLARDMAARDEGNTSSHAMHVLSVFWKDPFFLNLKLESGRSRRTSTEGPEVLSSPGCDVLTQLQTFTFGQ